LPEIIPLSLSVDLDHRPPLTFYLSVGLVAGSIIALQIGIMRVFSVGSWAHFGSLVVSLAMFGFGLTSAVMCVGKGWFERHWIGAVKGALLAFGPLMVVCNLVAQQVPFNAIFLISDPMQKWRLFANFVLYFLPFLAGALYLGTIFLKAKKTFNRVYFADLVGSGLCGLSVLLAMYIFRPDDLIMAPLLLWLAGGLLWFVALGDRRGLLSIVIVAILTAGVHYLAPPVLGIPKLAVSDYKGVAYARKFPDSKRTYERASPFGYMEVYSSSYLHFAPGQSDNAAFNLKNMPANAYLGLYIDSEGPSGIIKDLPAEETPYFRYLPMFYPYVLKQAPETFVVQFGGGISTAVALKSGSSHVTVAEGNPAVLTAFREDPGLRAFTNDVLRNPKISVVDYDGRLYLANTKNRYDIVDLSLADSAGLSAPGGFSIVEKYSYTREAMSAYMRALKPGGILSVTLWNKEEPPKSVLKLYATMAAAAKDVDGGNIAINSMSCRPTSRPRRFSTSATDSRPRRSRSSTPTPGRCRSTRSTTPASRSTNRTCRRSCRTIATSSSPRARPPIRPAHRRASPTTSRRPASSRSRPTARRPRPGCRRRCSAAWPGITWSMAAGRRWPTSMSSTPAS
jgi:hypothetical protein